jgi:hypothetical protein
MARFGENKKLKDINDKIVYTLNKLRRASADDISLKHVKTIKLLMKEKELVMCEHFLVLSKRSMHKQIARLRKRDIPDKECLLKDGKKL